MSVALFLVGFGLVTYVHAQGCSRPEGGPNMFLTGSDTFPVDQGTKVTFKCNIGYRREGRSGVVICVKGTWSPLRMRCTKKNCGSAGEVENGVINYNEGTEFGDRITITCNTGYVLIGRNEITCGDQGWLDRLPTCEEIECKAPEVKHGVVVGVSQPSYKYSESVTIECKVGFEMKGQSSLTCRDNSQWFPAPPECAQIEGKVPEVKDGEVVGGSQPS